MLLSKRNKYRDFWKTFRGKLQNGQKKILEQTKEVRERTEERKVRNKG